MPFLDGCNDFYDAFTRAWLPKPRCETSVLMKDSQMASDTKQPTLPVLLSRGLMTGPVLPTEQIAMRLSFGRAGRR